MDGLIPVPVAAPDTLKPFLVQVSEALQELLQPTKPARLYRTASTTLPPAANWTGCVVDLTDLDTLAKSNGTDWVRVDTGVAL